MREVILHGELGKRYGRAHKLDVKCPAEAVRALCANFRGFERFVSESADRGVGYVVKVGAATVEQLVELHAAPRGAIRIIPVVTGAAARQRNANKNIIVGVLLIIASYFFPPAGAMGAGLSASGVAFSIGVSLVIGGITQHLTSLPKADSPNEKDPNKPSYIFDGPVNTEAHGHPVPVGYGRMIVGSAVISAGIVTENILVPAEPAKI